MVEACKDFVELFHVLNERHCEYLIVGGYAVAFYGYPHFTGDIDIFTNPRADNADRIMEALEAFGFGELGISADDFKKADEIIQLGYPPERVDFVTGIDGVSWDEAWPGRMAGSYGGEPVFFIGRDELLRNKRAFGRKKDLLDVEELERGSRPRKKAKPPDGLIDTLKN
jgi:hypothetical protein